MSSLFPPSARNRRQAQLRRRVRRQLFENLETRNLLASDFIYDQTAAVSGLNATFEYDSTTVRLINNTNSAVLRSLPVSDFTGVVRILGANLYTDVIQISPPLNTTANYFTDIKIDAQGGDDRISVLRNLTIPGANIELAAETLSVSPNVTIATRSDTEPSGNITLQGVNISLGLNSSLRAEALGGFAAGDISIAASLAPDPLASGVSNFVLPLLITNNQVSVQLNNSQVVGGNVTIAADAATDTRFDELGDYADNIARDMVDALGTISDLAVSLVSPISGQIKSQKASSNIQLDNSTITASGTVSIDASARADASFDAVGINAVALPSPLIAVVGFGQTETKANINVSGSTTITAAGDVSINSNVEGVNDIATRGMGNARISNSDDVDVAVSIAMAFNQFESTITTGAATVIQSTNGSLTIHANGENEIASQADSILFRDGIAGIAVSVAVDKGTVLSTINGTLIANNPQGSTSYSFNANQVVNVSEDSITLSGIPEDQALVRGDKLIYNAGSPAIGGLVNGQEYLIADVENVPAGNDFTGVQKIWLADTMPLDIGNEAALPNSVQTLGKVALSTFPSSAAIADANSNLAITLPGIANGTRLTYLGPNSPVLENNIDATFARSAAGDTITRTDGRTGWKAMGLYVNQQIELVEAGTTNSRVFTIAGFSTDDRTLTVREANIVAAGAFTGFTLKTTPATPTGIGNLTQGAEYTAAIVGGRVLLRDPTNPAVFIKFAGAGSGIQGFRYVSATQSFSPATNVNPDRDTIFIANHGFQTGDMLVYRTDPTKSTQNNVYNFDSATPGVPTLIGTAQLPDNPVDGLGNGLYYFVTRVDANRIRLSENPVAARNAAYVNLTSAPAGTHSFSLPDKVVGIEVLATLSTENATGAGAELSDGQQPWADVIFNSINRPENLFLGLVNQMPFAQKLRSEAAEKKKAEETKNPLDENDPDGSVPLEFAGCFAVNAFQHIVETRIGSTAKIFSGKDLLIQSTIEQQYSSAVSSETTRNGLDAADTSDTGAQREDVEISVAFSLINGTNRVQSIVSDGAQLNAKGAMSIDSQLEYPLLIDDANAIVNPGKAVKNEGLDGFQFLLDGTLGLASLFNTSVAAIGGDPGSNKADIFVLGAAFNLAFFNNRSVASIGAGALINQDAAWFSNSQSLSVTATTHIETVDVDQNAVFNLSIPSIAEIGGDVFKESRAAPPGGTDGNGNNGGVQQSKAGQIKSTLRSLINPFGISGQNAIGPSIIVTGSNNVTVAEIKDGAKIRTGAAGAGVSVVSTQDILSVAIAQTGATASEFGLTLSMTIDNMVSETRANIGNNVVLAAPSLKIKADDNVERYAIDGSYVFGEKIGIGISVGLNYQERTTLAYLGAPTPTTDATTGPAQIIIGGETHITAHQGGNSFIFGLAGALLNDPDYVPAPEQPPTKPPPDPIASVTIGVGASVAINKAKNRVEAFIDDPALVTESLKLSSISDYEMRSIVIGGAVGSRKADTSFGIGGAFGVNQVESITRAFVRDADISTSGFLDDVTTRTGVSIVARDNTIIYADGGGVALMIGRGLRTSNNIAIGIGFSVNDLTGSAESFAEDSIIRSLGGGVVTQAVYDATIVAVSIGGAGAVSTNGSGNALNLTGAGAGSKNAINGGTYAKYINSDITAGTPVGPAPVDHFIALEAVDLSNIQADAGAVALALALSSIKQSYNLSFALAVGLNEITRETLAQVGGGSDLVAHDLRVLARSLSYIDSLTIGGTLSGGANSGAFSGAGSGNKLTLTTSAIVDRTPTLATNLSLTGNFSVLAQHKPTIVADAGGFAIALSKSTQNGVTGTLSVGIGASENIITSTVQALVEGAQLLLRADDILVSADSSPSISALTMGGAGAASISNSTAFTIAGAGAGSRNTIVSTVNARIKDTSPGVYIADGTLSILAKDNSIIVANSGALALLFTLPAGSNINASVGVSLAINSINATTIAKADNARLQSVGNVVIAADSQGSISALTVAGAAAVALATGSSSSGITFSGAGTGSGNNITSQTQALVEPTTQIVSNARVDVLTTNSSTIDAKAVSGSLAVQTSSGGSVAIGVSIAENKISREARALVRSATVTATAGMSVSVAATAVIRALAVGVAASVALNNGQGSFSLAASGAGAQARNSIVGTLESAIASRAVVDTLSGDLRVQTLDTSTIFADAGGGTFAASASTEGGSLAFSISAGIADNTISQSILARIEDSGTQVTVADKLDVIASSQSTIDTRAASVAGSVAIVNPKDGFALGLAGAGASATNLITNTILASIAERATVNARDTIAVRAVDNSSILAIVPAVSITFAIGAGFSISATIATNNISNNVDARIRNATTNSTSGGTIIEAQSNGLIEAYATPLSASISLGAAGGGGEATSTVSGRTRADLGNLSSVTAANGEVRVSAVTTAAARGETKGGGAALVNVNVMLASATVSTNTLAQIDRDARVTAGSLNVVTYGLDANDPGLSSRSANALVRVGGVGATLAGTGGRAIAKVDGSVTAFIASNAIITVTNATIVEAKSKSTANASAEGGGASQLAISALLADAQISGSTSATIDANVLLASGSLDVRADAEKDTDANILVVVLAIAGGGGGKATAIDSANTSASVGSSPSNLVNPAFQVTGAMNVTSHASESLTVDARGGGGGGIKAGGFVAEATSSGSTTARVQNGARINAGNLKVQADATRDAAATLLSVEITSVGLSVVSSTTKITGDIAASIGASAIIVTPNSGKVEVLATSSSTSNSKGDGGGGGAMANVSAFSASSLIGSDSDKVTTAAVVDDNTNIRTGTLTVDAHTQTNNIGNLLTVGIAGITSASATSDALTYADALARIGRGAQITTASTVLVDASSSQNASASNRAGGGGTVLALAIAAATSRVEGSTQALVDAAANVQSGLDVKVLSTVEGAGAVTNLIAGSAGTLSIGSTKAQAFNIPTVLATVGSNAKIKAAGSVQVIAIGRGEADIKAESSGGGILQVGVAYGSGTFTPTVRATTLPGSKIDADVNVFVTSQLLRSSGTSIPSDLIQDRADDADNLAIDLNNDVIDFAFPLSSGSTVIYDSPTGQPSIGGLVDNRPYTVQVVSPGRTIQLGNTFNAASSVDTTRDVINFSAPHNFKPGDAVYLRPNGFPSIVEPWQTTLPAGNPLRVDPASVLYVRGIYTNPNDENTLNPFSIRLARTLAEATAKDPSLLKSVPSAQIDPVSDRITLAGHNFQEGQSVTYRSNASFTFATESVDVKVVPATYRDANNVPRNTFDIERGRGGAAVHYENSNNIFLLAHTFATGDAVTYQTDGPALGGLINGTTYYVIKISDNEIQLARTYHEAVGLSFDAGGPGQADDVQAIAVTPIQISSAGPQGNTHRLSRSVRGLTHDQTYYVRNISGDTFQLSATRTGNIIQLEVVDTINILRTDGGIARTITPLTRGGTHRFGNLGIDLVSKSGTQSLVWDLTSQPSTNTHRLLAADGSQLSALAALNGDGVSNVTAFGGSGGGIDVGVPTALLKVAPSVSAEVASISTLLGNIEVKAISDFRATTFADTTSGGVASVGESHADTLVDSAPTIAKVLNGSALTSGQNISIFSDSTHSVSARALSKGGGLIAGRIAETTARLKSNTDTVIERDAKLTAAGLLKLDSEIDVQAVTYSETYAVGVGVGADSDNTNNDRGVTVESTTQVIINPDAQLVGKAVDLKANVAVVNVAATAKATSFSPILIGVTTAFADAYADVNVQSAVKILADNTPYNGTSLIRGDQGVDIEATYGPINVLRDAFALSVSTIPPQAARKLGDTNVGGAILAQAEALVVAGPRYGDFGLIVRNDIPALALYTYAKSVTLWDADIRLLSPSLELVIDSAGNPVTQRGITYRRTARSINLDNVTNSGPGQVLFEGNMVSGSQTTLTLDNAAPSIDITTYFGDLFVNRIQPNAIGVAGLQPKVTIANTINIWEFDVRYDYGPSNVSISNYEQQDIDFNIRLQGLIDNPMGTTEINSYRDVASASFDGRQGVIRTNRLIGSARNFGLPFVDELDRIPIDIVEVDDLPALIDIRASVDIYVGLQGINRSTAFGGLSTMKDNRSIFSAGNDADILLLGGINQPTVTGATQPGIIVHETASVTIPIKTTNASTVPSVSPRNTTVTDHFRVSKGTTPNFPLGIFGSGTDSIPVLYDLGLVAAGRNINIYKADLVTSKIDVFVDTNIIDGAGAGNVDVVTNGRIDVTETFGDLRVGRITSSADNVTVRSATRSILEVPDNGAATGDAAVDIAGVDVALFARSGAIGTFTKRLDVDSSVVGSGRISASALLGVYLSESAGNMNVTTLRSELLDVDVVVVSGNLVDIEGDPKEDLIGNFINITMLLNNGAQRGNVGSVGNPVEINSSTKRASGLRVTSAGNVNIVETAEELYVLSLGGIGNVLPNVFLTVREDASDRNDLILQNTLNVATATLTAGDDFEMAQDVALTATGNVTINIDPVATDLDTFGGTLTLLGQLISPTARLNGGDDIDLFNVASASTPATVEIFGGSPAFPVYPGDRLAVEPRGANVVNTTTSIPLGEGTVTALGRGTINYHSIEMIDDALLNDPPVNLLPPAQVTDAQSITLSLSNGNALKVLDPDVGNATNFSVTLTVPLGNLTLSSFAGVTITGNGTTQVQLVGSLADINGLLEQGVTFTVPNGFSGVSKINILSNDAGNTGVGGPRSDNDDLTITIGTDFNEPPVNRYPGDLVLSTPSITFSAANGNALSVADNDAGQAGDFVFSIGVDQGFFGILALRDVTLSGTGTLQDPFVLVGRLANINATLAAGVVLIMPDQFAGKVHVTMVSNDAGNTGVGGPKTDTDTFIVEFVDPNLAPVNSLPPAVVSDLRRIELNWRSGRQITVADADAGNADNFSVTLTVPIGLLIMRDEALAQYPNVLVNGNRSTSMSLEGTLSDINGLLTNGLQYGVEGGFFGTTTLTVVSNDAGNTGSPGPLTDTDTLNITIVADANDPPVNLLPPTITTNSTTLVLSTTNGNAISVSDVDAGPAVTFEVTLTASVGTLAMLNTNSITAQGSGTTASPLKLTGSLASINFALAGGLRTTMPAGFLGVNTIEVFSNDAGNTGSGGPKTDRDTFNINVVAVEVNDPPVNQLPNNFSTNQAFTLSAANGNALSVTDPDAGNAANFTVTLGIDLGFLTLANTGGIQVFGNGNSRNPMILTGTLANINAALAAGVTYARGNVPAGGQTYTITMVSNDAGNTGVGGPLSDTDVLVINTVPPDLPINDAPVNNLPAPVVTDRTNILLSQANGNGLSVSDSDAGDADNFSVTLSIPNVSIQIINPQVQLSFSGANGVNSVRLQGSLGQINQTLADGVMLSAGINFTGQLNLTILSNDAGNTGAGGPLTDTDVLNITVLGQVNDPPVNHLPDTITTDQTSIVLSAAKGNAISVTDVDAGIANNFRFELRPANGTLSLPVRPNVTVSGSGTAASPLVLVGALNFINAALAAGLTLTLPVDFGGGTTLNVLSNDAGNTGVGGPLTDSDTLQILVSGDVNDAPVNSLPTPITTDSTTIVLSSALGNALSVVDSDAGDANNFSVQLTMATGSLALTSDSGVTAVGVGSQNSPLIITGSLARINAVLSTGLTVTLPVGFLGNTSLRILSNDAGNTGLGGPKSDDDSLAITVLAQVNDGPINILPPAIVTDRTSIVLSQLRGNALSVTDIDTGNAPNFVVTLSIPVGTLSLVNAVSITTIGTGTLAAPLTMTGTLAAINTVLAQGVVINLPAGFTGTTSLIMLSNDNGNTGAGGPLTDLDLLSVTVQVDVNDPPVNSLPAPVNINPAPFIFSQANGNAISVSDIDAGGAANFSVRLAIDNAQLSLVDLNPTGVTIIGEGSLSVPLRLTGSLSNINAALANGLTVTPLAQVFGTLSLEVYSNDAGNTGSGGALTDTDYLSINVLKPANIAPYVVSVTADGAAWADDFRDFVDGDFGDKLAAGYRVPYGTAQLVSLPWVNVDRLKITFSEDVGKSLDLSDFGWSVAPGFTALAGTSTVLPRIIGWSYDSSTYTVTLQLGGAVPAAVFDLTVSAAGVFDEEAALLDGEWINGVTTTKSGNNTAGGDFSFRLFFLPGDTLDESNGKGTRTVNTNDSQVVRDRQNGFVVAGLGAVSYNPRADLDGSGFVNTNDSQLVRDRQSGIIFRQANINVAQNKSSQFDVNNDKSSTPMDALLIINALNAQAAGQSEDSDAPLFLDVSGDGVVTPLDALMVINLINSQARGEGEAVFASSSHLNQPISPLQTRDVALAELMNGHDVASPNTELDHWAWHSEDLLAADSEYIQKNKLRNEIRNKSR